MPAPALFVVLEWRGRRTHSGRMMSASLLQATAAVFGPAEIATLTEAYRTALSFIDEGSVRPEVPGHELRRRLASRIIEEARSGGSDPKLLAERALARLTA